VHNGGLIVPGLRMMQKSLASGTAGLPYDERVSQMNLATETGDGIANGALLAVTGLIENAMRRFAADYQLILTGGDADVLAESLSVPAIIDRKLVLSGLAVFCDGKQNP
jgi:type III pantothenate kinase